jgi:heme/copper-type cytochrome/quinol oxidase subunit 2
MRSLFWALMQRRLVFPTAVSGYLSVPSSLLLLLLLLLFLVVVVVVVVVVVGVVVVKVNESRNRPGVVQRVPGGLDSQIFMTFGT